MSVYSLLEIQVAEALLDLKYNARVFVNNVENLAPVNVEPNRALILSPNVQAPAQRAVVNLASVKPQADAYQAVDENNRSKVYTSQRKPIEYCPVVVFSGKPKSKMETVNTLANENNNKEVIMKAKRRDDGSSTDDSEEVQVTKRNKKTVSLEAEIKTVYARVSDSEDDESYKPNTDDMSDSDENYEPRKTMDNRIRKTEEMNKPGPSSASTNAKQVLTNRNINSETDDLVPIGSGKAKVPERILRFINWDSYSMATRKLLTAIFSRRVLATHCLTGERSKAFPTKPQKKKLDPALVHDIVQTVVERCHVPPNVVRMSITTKCADESKMFRNRQAQRKGKNRVNKENIATDSE